MTSDHHGQLKHVADIVSAAVVGASWLQWLSSGVLLLANAATLVWFIIRIWESATVQAWWARRKAGRAEPPGGH